MSDIERPDEDDSLATEQPELDRPETDEQPKLHLDVKIDARGACERHITATVAREDIDRYFDKEYSELMPRRRCRGFVPATRRGS